MVTEMFDEAASNTQVQTVRAVSSPDYGLISTLVIEQSVQTEKKLNPSKKSTMDYV